MDGKLIIKVCGMKDHSNINNILSSVEGIDWMGFIFYEKSKRYLDADFEIPDINVVKVGVFVNEHLDIVHAKVVRYNLDIVQLHGEESPEYCSDIRMKGVKVMKAFSIGERFDFHSLSRYEEKVDYFLFDTKGETIGGTGKKFNWNLLENYQGSIPFLLAGGIGPEDVNLIQAITLEKWLGVDINSRFEDAPGIKSLSKIKSFVDEIRS